MKTTTTTPTRSHKDQTEREAFFQKAYLALLSSSISQFESYDQEGNPVRLYSHPDLDREEERLTEKHDANFIRQKEDATLESQLQKLSTKIDQADERFRIETLVRRAYLMAQESTELYFSQREFSSHC